MAIQLLNGTSEPMLHIRRFSLWYLATICLPAASWGQNVETAVCGPMVASASDIPASSQSPSANSPQMTLGPSDVIRLTVWKNPDLSQTITIAPDGFISLPLVGNVQAVGLTSGQLEKTIAARLATYVVNPEVTVGIVEIRSRQVYILGQVSKPGSFPLIVPIHVLQLIAQAGGLTTYANRKGIVVLRPEQGGLKKISFNYNDVVRGDGKENIVLQPGDSVFVP
jgi:polysaccharide export outer membrane protein